MFELVCEGIYTIFLRRNACIRLGSGRFECVTQFPSALACVSSQVCQGYFCVGVGGADGIVGVLHYARGAD